MCARACVYVYVYLCVRVCIHANWNICVQVVEGIEFCAIAKELFAVERAHSTANVHIQSVDFFLV